jgi:hypothetical protein
MKVSIYENPNKQKRQLIIVLGYMLMKIIYLYTIPKNLFLVSKFLFILFTY